MEANACKVPRDLGRMEQNAVALVLPVAHLQLTRHPAAVAQSLRTLLISRLKVETTDGANREIAASDGMHESVQSL
jgi:hypothetical protein